MSLPVLRQLKTTELRENFSTIYAKASGLPIPESYLHDEKNRVFGIYKKQELIGGFILGQGASLRTIEIFASEEKQEALYETLNEKGAFTEICCFWIKRKVRTKTSLNFFIWLAMAYALKRYGNPYIIFGTCSRSLAHLYSVTSKVNFLNEDFIKRKPTFIFWSKYSHAFSGIVEIVFYKLKRTLRIVEKSGSVVNT